LGAPNKTVFKPKDEPGERKRFSGFFLVYRPSAMFQLFVPVVPSRLPDSLEPADLAFFATVGNNLVGTLCDLPAHWRSRFG
jgi:hypothetical protein